MFDELIQIRVKDKGDLYVHQDANWNVTALTDLGGSVVERYQYTPYGEVTVQPGRSGHRPDISWNGTWRLDVHVTPGVGASIEATTCLRGRWTDG